MDEKRPIGMVVGQSEWWSLLSGERMTSRGFENPAELDTCLGIFTVLHSSHLSMRIPITYFDLYEILLNGKGKT